VAVTNLDVAEMKTNAYLDAPRGRLCGVARRERPLDRDGAPRGLQRAGELDQEPVARLLDFPATVLREDRPQELPLLVKQRQCQPFVALGQSAIADHVGEHDCG